MLYAKWLIILILPILMSCKSTRVDSEDDAEVCSDSWQKQYVYDELHDFYFWYDHVATADPSDYSSASNLLSELRYEEYDHWSYLADAEDYSALTEEGKYVGVGLRFVEDGDALRVAMVYTDSPADATTIARGDELISVNGQAIDDLTTDEAWDAAWGEAEEGIAVTLQMKPAGEVNNVTYNLIKDEIDLVTVPIVKTFDYAGGTMGYLLLTSFLVTSEAELLDAFSTLHDANVNELILDLRYNPGGRLSVSAKLGSLIAGSKAAGNTFAKLQYNENYTSYNSSVKFSSQANALNLDRVIVLTTAESCSASEALINGLKPFVDVIQIGGATCGKPVGMNPDEFCDKVLIAINFEYVNSEDVGEFYDGIEPLCGASDDLFHALGESDESLLAAGKAFIENGTCDAVTFNRGRMATQGSKALRGWHRLFGVN